MPTKSSVMSHDIIWVMVDSTLCGASRPKSCLDVPDIGYANTVKDNSLNPRKTKSQITHGFIFLCRLASVLPVHLRHLSTQEFVELFAAESGL